MTNWLKPLLLLLAVQSAASEPGAIDLYLAGSSAQDGALENLMRLRPGLGDTPNICRENTLQVLHGELDGVRQRLYSCVTSDRVDGVPPGLRLRVHKSSGGSLQGIRSVVDGEAVGFMRLDAGQAATACGTPSPSLRSGNLSAYTVYRDCASTPESVIPDAGISDLAPELLGIRDRRLSVSHTSRIVWGLPVSKNLRNALQALQGLVAADVPHDAPERDSLENMPELPREIVSGIFSGEISSWAELADTDGAPAYLSRFLPAQPPTRPDVSGTSPGAYRPDEDNGSRVFVCRRTVDSGTQAAFDVHYLQSRCGNGATASFIQPDDGSELDAGGDPAGLLRRVDPAGRIFAGRGSADVIACLDAHDDFNRWAIGILSTEDIGNNGRREFRHIRIEGVAPSLANARAGRWLHVTSPTILWLEDAPAKPLSAAGDRALRYIRDNIGREEILDSLNASFVHPWGRGGYIGADAPVPAHEPRPPSCTADGAAAGEPGMD